MQPPVCGCGEGDCGVSAAAKSLRDREGDGPGGLRVDCDGDDGDHLSSHCYPFRNAHRTQGGGEGVECRN